MTLDIPALLHQIKTGDETALAVLYATYSRPVYSLALQILHSPALAQEVMQDAFMKVWNTPHAYDPARGAFVSWLLTVTRYTAIDRLRQEKRRTEKNVALDDNLPAEQDERLAEYDAEQLRGLLTAIPEEQHLLIQLAYFQGMTHSEMAETLGIPVGTVKTRLRLGLQKLRGLLISKTGGDF